MIETNVVIQTRVSEFIDEETTLGCLSILT